MKISDKLLVKIKNQFPEINNSQIEKHKLRVVRGINDGCRFKWSNGMVGEQHLFSYYTMKECLEKEITIRFHYPLEGNHGWEILLK